MLSLKLRNDVLEANLELDRRGLVIYTFGNASGIDRQQGIIAIKPSGIPYNRLKAEDLVLTDVEGVVIEGELNPSTDLETHLCLYREFPSLGGIVHTHSEFATSWAQALRPIPCYGTTHADYFQGEVPITDPLTDGEIEGEYEKNTGKAIARRFRTLDPAAVPGVLVSGHGPFTWGESPASAAYNAVILEYLARLAFRTETVNTQVAPVSAALLRRHHQRKHGTNATYGQRPE